MKVFHIFNSAIFSLACSLSYQLVYKSPVLLLLLFPSPSHVTSDTCHHLIRPAAPSSTFFSFFSFYFCLFLNSPSSFFPIRLFFLLDYFLFLLFSLSLLLLPCLSCLLPLGLVPPLFSSSHFYPSFSFSSFLLISSLRSSSSLSTSSFSFVRRLFP